MKISRDARWALGLVVLIGLGASAVRWRAEGRGQVATGASPVPSRARIDVLDRSERERKIYDENGRLYVLDWRNLSVCGVQLNMSVDEAMKALGEESCTWPESREDRVIVMGARGVKVYVTGNLVHGVKGPRLESNGLLLGQRSDALGDVNARLANAMAESTSLVDRDGVVLPPTTPQERRFVTFTCTFADVEVKGSTDLHYTLFWKDQDLSAGRSWPAIESAIHPVDYATFMRLHGHPVDAGLTNAYHR